jgi:glycosyltransferase involved in cell wall biosynthesis
MKLLFCIKTLNEAKGGAERVFVDLVHAMQAKGHEVYVLTFDFPNGQSFYPLSSEIKRIDLGIGDVRCRTSFLDMIQRMIGLRKAVIAINPEVVIGFMHSMFIPLSLALVGMRVPVVASEHIVPAHYQNRKFEFLLLLLSFLRVRKFTVLSEDVKKLYPACVQSKIISIANPVYSADQRNAPKDEGARNVILNIGRLDPQKDQKTLIHAFGPLAVLYPDWDVHIYGEGQLRPELEALAMRLNLKNRVFLKGTTKDISSVYNQADIFAIPSLYESFGLVTAEAMAHGLPVVGFADCTGTNELVVDGKTGILVSGEDRVLAFRQGLESLMKSPDLCFQYGEAGRVYIQKYAPDVIFNQWENLLLSCLDKVA